MGNSVDPDQMLHCVMSDLGVHSLLRLFSPNNHGKINFSHIQLEIIEHLSWIVLRIKLANLLFFFFFFFHFISGRKTQMLILVCQIYLPGGQGKSL